MSAGLVEAQGPELLPVDQLADRREVQRGEQCTGQLPFCCGLRLRPGLQAGIGERRRDVPGLPDQQAEVGDDDGEPSGIGETQDWPVMARTATVMRASRPR